MSKVLEEYVDNLCDCFQQWKSDAYEHDDTAGIRTLDSCIEYARESMEDYTDDWIPVSERLPEEIGDYIVTDKDGFTFESEFDKHRRFDSPNVIAWQPLPEPYKEKK